MTFVYSAAKLIVQIVGVKSVVSYCATFFQQI